MRKIEEQGRKIAQQLGNDIVYNGPQYLNDEFIFHVFTDVAVTGTTFAAKTFEEAKANLIEKRKLFGAKPPIFVNPTMGNPLFEAGIIHRSSPIEDVAAVRSGEKLFAEQGEDVFLQAIGEGILGKETLPKELVIEKIDGGEVLYLKSRADEVAPIIKRLREMALEPASVEKVRERGRLFGYSEADINAFLGNPVPEAPAFGLSSFYINYNRALKMLREGSTIDEVVSAKVLSVPEAKQLMSSYKKILRNRHLLGLDTEQALRDAIIGDIRPPAVEAGNPSLGTMPIGTCYDDAWRAIIRFEEGELVHGSIESKGKRIGHAWVELPTGFVWEPGSGEFIKTDVFRDVFKPVTEARYTDLEAAKMGARIGNFGPWKQEEREKILEASNPTSMYKSVADLPEFRGRAWRAESGYTHLRGTTAADIIRFEREELGNEYPDVSDELLKELDRYSAYDVVWVNRRRKDCLTYLSEGESEEAVGRVDLGGGAKVITLDYCGGYLVLRGSAKPILKIGGNPMKPKTEEERLSFHERIFGKGEKSPAERLGRGQAVNDLMPMPPESGPPLPRMLKIRWPWKK